MNYRFAWALYGFLAHDKLTASELDDRLEALRRDTPAPWLLSQMNLIDSHDTWRALTACNADKRRLKQMVAFQLAYPGSPMIYYGDEAGLQGDYAESGRRAFPWDGIDQDLHGFYKRALAYRRTSNALRYGSIETVVIEDAQCIYGFARRSDGEAVYAIFNASDTPVICAIPLQPGEAGRWNDMIGEHGPVEAQADRLTVQLEPRGFAWYAR